MHTLQFALRCGQEQVFRLLPCLRIVSLRRNSINREPLTGFGYDAYINFTAREYTLRK
jgi:hypothetical protein